MIHDYPPKIGIAALVSSLFMVSIAAVISVMLHMVGDLRETGRSIASATGMIQTLRGLANEYAEYNSPRFPQQWAALENDAAEILKRIAASDVTPIGVEAELTERLARMSDSFGQLHRARSDGSFDDRLGRFLTTRVIIESNAMTSRFELIRAHLDDRESAIATAAMVAVCLLALLCVAINLGVSFATDRLILRPLDHLKEHAVAIGRGNFGHRVSTERADEIGDLFASVDTMRHNLSNLASDLMTKREEADQANRAKTEFLANMSHELRTPLNAVIGYSDLIDHLIAREPGLAKMREYANSINFAGKQLLDLITDLLDVARIEAGHINLESARFEVPDLLGHVQAALAHKARTNDVRLVVDASDPIPALSADVVRIRQVLFNLIDNAIKFSAGGTVSVAVSHRPIDPARTMLTISVRDDGIGIEKDRLDDIFKPFSQEDASTTRRFGGTGLGLAITKSISEAMGGTVTVESTKGEGSTFTACFDVELADPLPVMRVPSNANEATVLPANDTATDASLVSPQVRARVLVVDDVDENIDLVTETLVPLGCELVSAENGARAVELAVNEPFDLVLLDINMPVMDGLTAARRIRAGESAKGGGARVPIWAWTADVMRRDAADFLSAGIDGVIVKPARRKDVLHVLNKAVGRARMRGGMDQSIDFTRPTAATRASISGSTMPRVRKDAAVLA